MERIMTCVNERHALSERQPDVVERRRTPWRVRLARWRQLRRERYALQQLNDDLLKDIGLSREVVQREARRPFWDDRGWRR
ncbi:hypothetical protein GCM10007158_30400 [Vreelandella hamiltonii]|uniref:YjiS-like domain-containing protein n=2 Tax=Halomonadaceae TaxID=28256 RepID=A0ABQ2WPX1_9GAMM|nr:hypothetical protein GCM10007158_30400 [Halomonas johnsoniae]